MNPKWTLTEPRPGVVCINFTTAAGNPLSVIALTEKEADNLHNDLGIELYDRDVRAGRVKEAYPPNFDPDAGLGDAEAEKEHKSGTVMGHFDAIMGLLKDA